MAHFIAAEGASCSNTAITGDRSIASCSNQEIRKMVLKGVDSTQIREVAKQRGMMTLLNNGLQRIKRSDKL